MGRSVGIDLGTTNSVVSVLVGGKPKVIPVDGRDTLPSVVYYGDEVLVGALAKGQTAVDPERTARSIKRFMGRDFGEVSGEIAQSGQHVVSGAHDKAEIEIGGKNLLPQQISARVLQKLKAAAEDYLGEPVTNAVITVPAWFNDAQRLATKEAGEIAGLQVDRIVNEPTAAALSYGLGQGKDETVLVFDLGGGTFDVSVLEIGQARGKDVFEVKSTKGDTHLGGDDYDNAIVELLARKCEEKAPGSNPLADPEAKGRLLEAAEQAKKDLSSSTQVRVQLPYLTFIQGGGKPQPVHFDYTLTRMEFEQITRPLTERCRGPVQEALQAAGIGVDDLTSVILVGGSTRMPAVQEMVKEILGPGNLQKLRHPDRDGVDVDLAVAEGASIQAGVLMGEVKNVLLLDVTPLTLGIAGAGDEMFVLIPANTKVPMTAEEVFTTVKDGQRSVGVKVYQGERTQASLNRKLGEFSLWIQPDTKKGDPQIQVTFAIDANGIVTVEAKDLDTQKVESITIQASKLSADDIARMKAEAEANAEQDRRFAEIAEARSGAAPLLEQTATDMQQIEPILEAADPDAWRELKAEVERNSAQLQAAAGGRDDQRLVSAYGELKASLAKVADSFREAQAARAPQADAAEAPAEPAAPQGPQNGQPPATGAPDFGDLA